MIPVNKSDLEKAINLTNQARDFILDSSESDYLSTINKAKDIASEVEALAGEYVYVKDQCRNIKSKIEEGHKSSREDDNVERVLTALEHAYKRIDIELTRRLKTVEGEY